MAIVAGPWATANGTVPDHVDAPDRVIFPGPWTPVNALVPDVARVDWWTISNGVRRPLYTRPRLTPAKIRAALNDKDGTFHPEPGVNIGHYTPKNQLEVIDGNVTITQAGTVLAHKWVRGRISVAAPNVTIDDCLASGPSSGSATGAIVTATNVATKNLLITDTEIAPENPNDRVNCFEGHHATFRRVNAHHGVDIIGVIGQLSDSNVDVKVLSSYLHTMVMSNTDTQPTDNITHNDLIQWHGLIGLMLLGARLEAFVDPNFGVAQQQPVWGPVGSNGKPTLISGNPNYPWLTGFSVVMASPARKLMGGFSMHRSWVDGGAVGLNFGGPTQELFPDGGSITDSWFGDGYRLGPDYGLLTKSFRTHAISGNHRWNKSNPFDTSVAFNPRKNG